MVKTVEIICTVCGNKCDKVFSYIERQKKKGQTHFFCSRRCSSSRQENKERIKTIGKLNYFTKNNQYAMNRIDEFTPFKYHIRNAKRRKDHGEFSITSSYLKELWESQNGLCAVTGLKLEHRYFSSWKHDKKSPYQASLDRIDNSKGYIVGNIRFVCLMYNYARNNFSDEETIEFFNKVKNYYKPEN